MNRDNDLPQAIDNDHLWQFLAQGKWYCDWAEALAGELAGWQMHSAFLRVGKECGLADSETLEIMGYEEDG